jgi:hypothetical protein
MLWLYPLVLKIYLIWKVWLLESKDCNFQNIAILSVSYKHYNRFLSIVISETLSASSLAKCHNLNVTYVSIPRSDIL